MLPKLPPNFEELLLSFTSCRLFKLKMSPLMGDYSVFSTLYVFSENMKMSIKIRFSFFFFLRTAETAYVRQLNYICFAFLILKKELSTYFFKIK